MPLAVRRFYNATDDAPLAVAVDPIVGAFIAPSQSVRLLRRSMPLRRVGARGAVLRLRTKERRI